MYHVSGEKASLFSKLVVVKVKGSSHSGQVSHTPLPTQTQAPAHFQLQKKVAQEIRRRGE